MSDPLNRQIIERLRDAATHAAEGGYEIDFAVVFVDCAKTILALIDERDRLIAQTWSLGTRGDEAIEKLREREAEFMRDWIALRSENVALRAERERLLAVAEAANAFKRDESEDRAETMVAMYDAIDAWKAAR